MEVGNELEISTTQSAALTKLVGLHCNEPGMRDPPDPILFGGWFDSGFSWGWSGYMFIFYFSPVKSVTGLSFGCSNLSLPRIWPMPAQLAN